MKTKKKTHRRANHKQPVSSTRPFIEHAHELRRRIYYVVLSIIVWSTAAYFVQQQLVKLLLKPAKGQDFIYTSPGGGIDFLFRVCLYVGLVFSLPVIVYNCLRFIEPLITRDSHRFIVIGSLISGLLAAAGVIFGYLVGLPGIMDFLVHQFTTQQIKPLLTIQSYLNFVVVYMVGSALLLQLPLIMVFINRIKPLKPSRLLRYERWVILFAFVMAAIMNPTPSIISLLLIAAPLILTYQIGIGIIAFINRPQRLSPAEQLYKQDQEAQSLRQQHRTTLKPLVTKQQTEGFDS